MTEFKKTVQDLENLEEVLDSLANDISTPPQKLATFSAAKIMRKGPIRLGSQRCALFPEFVAPRLMFAAIETKHEEDGEKKARLEGELSQKVAKFEKRLHETDPVTGTPRYGESMTAKVGALSAKLQTLFQRLGGMEADMTAAVARHESSEAVNAEYVRKREEERQKEEETRARIRRAEAEEERRRAVAAQSILDRERERQAAEAARSREERRFAAEQEEARLAEDKRRREREAQELTSSVAVGAAGVEDGLRRIDDACGGNPPEKKVAVEALVQILRNVASNPEDPRFRRIKIDNENFQRALGRFEGGIQILLSSGFKMQVEEGQTVLVMNEPDLSEKMDEWAEWYKNITEAAERLKLELDTRF